MHNLSKFAVRFVSLKQLWSETVLIKNIIVYNKHFLCTTQSLIAAAKLLLLNTYGRRAFSVAGPMAWNWLQDFIRDPTSSTDCFRRLLKMYLFAHY